MSNPRERLDVVKLVCTTYFFNCKQAGSYTRPLLELT